MGLLLYLNIVKTQHAFHVFSFGRSTAFWFCTENVCSNSDAAMISHTGQYQPLQAKISHSEFPCLSCAKSLDMTFHLDLYLHRASNVKYVAFTQNCLLLQHPMVCRYFTTKTTTRLEAEVTNNTGLTLREFLITDPIPIQKCLSM